MFHVDISPNPIQISIGGSGGGGGSPDAPRHFIKLVDISDASVKYAYLDGGILYISDQPPEV